MSTSSEEYVNDITLHILQIKNLLHKPKNI